MPRTATIPVPGLKVALVLRPEQLPRDLVPAEGPPGEPTLMLALGEKTFVRARLNGRNYRRMMRQVAEAPSDARVSIVLGGTLLAPAAPGAAMTLRDAGFQVAVKPAKVAEPAAAEATPGPAG